MAIVLIVSVHCIFLDFINWEIPDSFIATLLYYFLLLSSTLFVFIAGFLFQHLSNKYSFKHYIFSKLKFIILPYIIVSIPAIVKVIYLPFSDDIQLIPDYPVFAQVLAYYVTGNHIGSFWFIPAITIFYILSPIFFALDKNRTIYWFLPLLFMVSVLIPREVSPYHTIHNPLQSFAHFFSVYIFGMFVSRYKEQVLQYSQRYLWVLVIIFTVFFSMELYYKLIFYNELVNYGFNFFRWIALCLIITYLFFKYDHKIGKKLNPLAEMSFGIFFVHSYFLSFLQKTFSYLQISLSGNILIILCVSAFIISASMTFLWVMKKTFGNHSRLLVGY